MYQNQETGDGYLNYHMRTIKIDDECLPPSAKPKKTRPPGPNQKKRKEKGDKPERPQGSQAYMRCGHIGHNKRMQRVSCVEAILRVYFD
jgi:hypothetical protein